MAQWKKLKWSSDAFAVVNRGRKGLAGVRLDQIFNKREDAKQFRDEHLSEGSTHLSVRKVHVRIETI